MIQQPDPLGLLAAVISAALFTFVIVFVARSRQGKTEIQTSLTAAFSPQLRQPERELFANVLLERRPPGLGLAASISIHLWVMLSVPALPYLFPEKLRFDFRNYDVKIIEFRLPAPVLYSASNAGKPARATPARIERPASRAAKAALPSQIARGLKFELPTSWRGRSPDVILQPDRPPERTPLLPTSLPTAFLWAQRPAPLDQPQLVGRPETHAEPPRPFLLPRAVPRLQTPNQEMMVSNLQMGRGSITTFRPPKLLLPPANVTPIRVPGLDLELRGELPATALPSGIPLNLIAFMRKPAPPRPAYLLETGNLLAGAEGGAGGTGPDSNTTPGGPSSGSAESGSGAVKGTQVDLLAAAPARPDDDPDLDKRAEPAGAPPGPAGGNLGVIIVQQSSQESILEGAEALSGEPVYTVFFDVPGAPRRWVLQYCVTGSKPEPSLQTADGVIRVVPRKTVLPPYPLERVPVEVNGYSGGARRLVVYAVVNERGETESVRLIRGAGEEIDRVALATLQRWSFRPATRGDTPVAVEALFGIPLQ